MGQTKQSQNKPKEKTMNIVLTLLPLGLVAANYLVADLRDRRRPEHDHICG
jgi:hypothetical protein